MSKFKNELRDEDDADVLAATLEAEQQVQVKREKRLAEEENDPTTVKIMRENEDDDALEVWQLIAKYKPFDPGDYSSDSDDGYET